MGLGYLGLGSNIGKRRAHLQEAVDRLPAHGCRVLACSSVYDTEPVGLVLDQPEFLNGARRSRPTTTPSSCSTPARPSSGRSAARQAAFATGRE